jgi:N-methylhydantoinase A/oxoprolinase/acetone carboxylase beta subunit
MVVALDELEWPAIARLFEAMEADARRTLARMGLASDAVMIERSVDARYVSQGHEFSVPLPAGLTPTNARTRIAGEFERVYTRLFGRTVAGVPVECITWRTTIRGGDGNLPSPTVHASTQSTPPSTRPAYFRAARGALDTPVYRRENLSVDEESNGPAIIEEAQSTTVIGPGDRFEVDEHLNIVVFLE